MITIIVTKADHNQIRFSSSVGHRFCGKQLMGTVCESDVLRKLSGNASARAVEAWPTPCHVGTVSTLQQLESGLSRGMGQ